MGFPVEAPQPHEHAQVPPGAPQEPSMQVGVQQVAALRLSQQKTYWRMCENSACFVSLHLPQLLQQLPAERVEQKEIPAEHMILKSTFDSLVQRCQLAARDPVCEPDCGFTLLLRFKIDRLGTRIKKDVWIHQMTKDVSFSANEKETGRRSQTFGIPVRQAERADSRNRLPFYFLA